MIRLSGLLAGAAVVLSPLAAGAETWDMPVAYAASNYHTENAVQFAEDVKEATGGELEITVHPSGSLYKGDEIKRAVQTGQAQIGERLISALGNENPLFEVDALPFLATSFEDAKRLYEAQKPALEEILAEQNLKLLYAVPWPPQGLYTKKPVESKEDMAGVKFRAYNAMTSRVAELMGAVPTQIEAAEISQAFATGVAESMISSGSTGYDRKLWEHTSHWYDTQAWLPKNMVIVNQDAFDGLPEDQQQALLDAAQQAEERGWQKAEELADWYKEQLAAEGMEVGPPGEQLQKDFEQIGETMTQEWLEKAGEDGQMVIDAYEGAAG
ncbi:MAG: TRAP transporter substrate-binding protein [Geminicoccaceae bacterium]|nr:TRAP transporter substrate-binding protein [Geminicoccaceae bacterium]